MCCVTSADGRVVVSHFRTADGPLIGCAPELADLARNLAAGVDVEELRRRAAALLPRIDKR
jgi:hypothetical protein